MTPRTFAIGDVHGDLPALERLLARLPLLSADDTVVFLGDYVDRGPDSRGVVRRIQMFQALSPARVVVLRGNHEDRWIECARRELDTSFLLPPTNGCQHTFRSFTGGPPLADDEEIDAQELERFLDVRSWMPASVVEWMESMPLWYENEHALFVHAGVEGRGERWRHPSRSAPVHLLWARRLDFFTGYRGKRLVFGHTAVDDLPTDHLGPYARLLEGRLEVWQRGDLIGLDTACGKGGHLSAIELPSLRIYDSRPELEMYVEDEPRYATAL